MVPPNQCQYFGASYPPLTAGYSCTLPPLTAGYSSTLLRLPRAIPTTLPHQIFIRYQHGSFFQSSSEAESREKHGVCDPMPELTTVQPHFMSTPESTLTHFTMDNLMPESTLTLCQSRLYNSETLDLTSGVNGLFFLHISVLINFL